MKYYYRLKHWFLIKTGLIKSYDMGKYFALGIKCGYISSNGTPLLCQKCGGHTFKYGKSYTEEGIGMVEYEWLCNRCDHCVGYWAYGTWTV